MATYNEIIKQILGSDAIGSKGDGLSSNWGQTVSFDIEPVKHLKDFSLKLRFKTGAGQGAKTFVADGLFNLAKRIKFEFNEDGAAFAILDVTGPALAALRPQLQAMQDTLSVGALNTTAIAASTTYEVTFSWSWDDPRLGAPGSYRACIPMYRSKGTKPRLSITLPALTELTTDGSALVPDAVLQGVEIVGCYTLLDIPDPQNNYPYWRTVVKTYDFGPNGAARNDMRFTFERGGVITGVLQQNYTSANARGSILNDYTNDKIEVYYGQRKIQELREWQVVARNQRSMVLYATTAAGWSVLANTQFYDFISDESLSETILLASGLDVSIDALDNGDCYMQYAKMTATAYAKMTVLKYREKKADLLAITL